jgi:hypothetical protein
MPRLPVLLAVAFSLAACSTSRWATQPDLQVLSDLPEAFVAAADGRESAAFRNPLRDPRDGSVLALVRSDAGEGDYAVDGPRYGLPDAKLLRVDCRSGKPLGAVAR